MLVGICVCGYVRKQWRETNDLAQASLLRPGKTCRKWVRFTFELSLRRRTLVWARQRLAQARGARLSEIVWRPWLFAAFLAQAREGFAFGRGMVSLRRGGLA